MCGAAEQIAAGKRLFPPSSPREASMKKKTRMKVDFFKMSFFNDLSVRQKVERGEK